MTISVRRIVCLLACSAFVAASSLGAFTEPASADTTSPAGDGTLASHFYTLGVKQISSTASFPWIAEGPGSINFALGADAGLGPNPNQGGSVLGYPVAELNPAEGTLRDLGTLDLSSAVEVGSRVRILDFVWSPQLQRRPESERSLALVSFASYEPESGCRRLQVYEAWIDGSGSGQNALGGPWFRMPCLKVVNDPDLGVPGPVLHQSGGRIVITPGTGSPKLRSIFLSIGDFQVLANKAKQIPPRLRSLLGTVIEVRRGGRPHVVSSGLRNPQGLTFAKLDGDSALVASFHGPRGGDELVHVEPGRDYGWPRESYGTVYDAKPTPMQARPAREGYLSASAVPLFAWLPSIGPGPLVQVRGRAFHQWWGAPGGGASADLLLAGMRTKSLYRIRWQEGAVRYLEPIEIGFRIRSLVQTPGGVLVAGTDEGKVLIIRPLAAWNSAASTFQ